MMPQGPTHQQHCHKAVQTTPSNDHKFRLLKGAMFEYLDDGELDEMITDMSQFLKQEEEKALRMASMYKEARKLFCGDKK
jgi:hypothetical protein